jgi:hypothetical protein
MAPDDYVQATVDPIARPRPIADVEAHVLGDDLLLYRSASEMAYSLNSAAKMVWELCDGTRTVDEIAAEIATRLGAPDDTRDELLRDVRDTVGQFERYDLLLPERR